MTKRIACCLAVLAAIVHVGCGRKPPAAQRSPVAEVAVDESGVQLSNTSSSIAESDWPAWRGPLQSGIVPDQALPTRWSETTNVRWASNVPGRGHGSPIVVGDSIYLATAVDALEQHRVLAYEKSTGELRWDEIIHSGGFPSSDEIHKKGTNANGTLACDGELLFAVFFNSGKIIATALDFEGQQVWQRDVGSFSSKFGYAPSPILYQSFVIIAADNWGGGYLAALDTKTGEIAWRVARGETSTYSSPMSASIGGRDQLLISGCGGVTSYDPATGDQLWRTSCISDATCGTIVTDGTCIFASGGYPDKETVCLSADGEKLWSNKTKIYEPSMIVANGSLYAVSDNGIAYCWDAESGKIHWRERLGGNFSASPILCDRLIYVTNLSGETFVFQANSESYQEVAKNQLGEDCYASPAASDRDLFLRIGFGGGDGRTEKLVCVSDDGQQAP